MQQFSTMKIQPDNVFLREFWRRGILVFWPQHSVAASLNFFHSRTHIVIQYNEGCTLYSNNHGITNKNVTLQ